MAVYTALSARDMGALTRQWCAAPLTDYGGIAAGVENTTYWLRLGRRKYALSIYEKPMAVKDLRFFLSLMDHLADAGLPVPRPLTTRRGTPLASVKGKPCALTPFLPGASLKRPSAKACRALGALIAEMHASAASFAPRRKNPLGRDGWARLLRAIRTTNPLPDAQWQFAQDAMAHYTAAWPKALRRGIIHNDMFPDNVLFRGGKISGLMDFSFACEDVLLYDVAIALTAWAFAPQRPWAFDDKKAAALLAGYQQRRALTAPERRALPILAGAAALQFFLTRQQEWGRRQTSALKDAGAGKDAREYFAKLQFLRAHGDALAALI